MSNAIASLGMYDHPGQREANDRLWAGIARALRERGVADVPEALDRRRPVQDHWRDPDLLFGQICGFPLVSDATLALRVLAVPVYDAPGCGAGTHRSFLVTRHDDATALEAYRGRRAAINDRGSNTGMNLFRAAIAGIADGQPFFSDVRETGAHRLSISAIILGEADIAAIDAVTFAGVLRAEPELGASLRIIATSVESAAPPFVTSVTTAAEKVAALRAALTDVFADPALADAREALFLRAVLPAGPDRYAPLLALEIEARAAGYPELH